MEEGRRGGMKVILNDEFLTSLPPLLHVKLILLEEPAWASFKTR
jgi:hypothetical protein